MTSTRKMASLAAICLVNMACGHAQTIAEERAGYTYIPLDPFPAKENRHSCVAPNRPVIVPAALPDNSVRTSVLELSANGDVSFSVGSVSTEGKTYRVTIDYANTSTVQVPFWIKKEVNVWNYETKKPGPVEIVHPTVLAQEKYQLGSARYTVTHADPSDASYHKFSIPLYIGVGLRVTSNVTAAKAKVDISGLAAIGGGAEAQALSGSLVVQTLGINGKSVASAMPIHSELNRTTVATAITAIASVKAQLYSDETFLQPRVLGMYLPLPADTKLVNAIISSLADSDIKWVRPCTENGLDGPRLVPAL